MSDTISSVEETVVSGDIVTTTTETKTVETTNTCREFAQLNFHFHRSMPIIPLRRPRLLTKLISKNLSSSMTTIDHADFSADEDNHMTSICQSTSEPADLDRKIIRQIEYYFSDVNLLRDKFLQNEMSKNDGWIPLSVLTTFKRLQALTTDFKTIINALQKSFSGLLQLNEVENEIRRHPDRRLPISENELQQTLKTRTVHVQGFPTTIDVTLDKLFQFFEQYDSTDNIQMKKSKDKEFNGCVSVVFPTDEAARQFVENSRQTPIKYDDGSILECSFKTDPPKNQPNIKEKPTLTGALIHLAGKITSTTKHVFNLIFSYAG